MLSWFALTIYLGEALVDHIVVYSYFMMVLLIYNPTNKFYVYVLNFFFFLLFKNMFLNFNYTLWAWKDVSVVKSTGCSFRGLKFYSQHPHYHLQLSVTPDPENPGPSSGLHAHQAHMWCREICVGKIPIYIKYSLKR